MSIIGVQRSTSHEHPCIEYRRFRTLKLAWAWVDQRNGVRAYPAADEEHGCPPSQVNLHHIHRAVFEMPKGWRVPTMKKLLNRFMRYSGDYYRSTTPMSSLVIRAIYEDGEVKER